MKRTIAILAAALLALQMLCPAALAAPDAASAVAPDIASKSVTVSGTGYPSNAQLSILGAYNEQPSLQGADYIDQVETNADGSFSITFPSAKSDWKSGDTYYAAVNGLVFSAVITSSTEKHISVEVLTTSKIVSGYKAHIQIKAVAVNFTPDAPIVVVLKDGAGAANGSVTVGADGTGLLSTAAAFQAPGVYTLEATCGDVSGTGSLTVVERPANIWALNLTSNTIGFNAGIATNSAYAVTINGADATITAINGNVLTLASPIPSGATVVVKNVKFPEFFPSYSFTFTVTAP